MAEEEFARQQAGDGDETLRFYCHLDFHELFSPRCKSCKTPIEGEVIVACGAEWHVGFPIYNRFVWGVFGSFFPLLMRITLSSVWYGVQLVL